LVILGLGAGVAAATPWLLDRAVFVGANLDMQRTPRPSDARQIWLDRPGARLESWFFQSSSAPAANAPAVLYFHGNAELIDNNIGLARAYAAQGFHVLLAEYRGYGGSTGSPSAPTLPGDAAAFFDLLAEQPEVDSARIIVIGRSLGGAAAGAVLAQRRPCAASLEQTFTSLADMVAAAGFPSFLAGDHLNTAQAVRRFSGPVLVMHGQADEVIPFAQGRRLGAIAAERPDAQSRFVSFPGGHNPMAPFPAIHAEAVAFLAATPCGPLSPQ
jgi:uncharacterized protein